MDVLLRGCGDDVVMVGHEDDMMDENLIFFSTFRDCQKGYTCDLLLVEPEGPIVGTIDKMVRKCGLYDTEWSSHAMLRAQGVPKRL